MFSESAIVVSNLINGGMVGVGIMLTLNCLRRLEEMSLPLPAWELMTFAVLFDGNMMGSGRFPMLVSFRFTGSIMLFSSESIGIGGSGCNIDGLGCW